VEKKNKANKAIITFLYLNMGKTVSSAGFGKNFFYREKMIRNYGYIRKYFTTKQKILQYSEVYF